MWRDAVSELLTNYQTSNLLAIQGINSTRQIDLFIALINQLDSVINRLDNTQIAEQDLIDSWLAIQSEIRQESLRRTAGTYVSLPMEGKVTPVVDMLLKSTDLNSLDEELPNPELF